MARVGTAQYGVYYRVLGCLFLIADGRAFQVEGNRVAQKLDMRQLLCRRRHQEITNPIVPPRAHRLEKILHGDAYFAFDAADGLLQKLGKLRVGFVYAHGVLQF